MPEPTTEPRYLLVLASSGGGVGRHVRDLAVGLADGADVLVAGPTPTQETFAFPRFAAVEIADRPRSGDAVALWRLRGLASRADAVHAHGLRAGALAILAARTLRHRPPVLVTLHNALVAGGSVAVVHRGLERIVARGADVVLTVSPDLAERMRALGARRVVHALVPAGRPDAAPAPEANDDEETAALLVTVARLAPQKGLDDLLDAVALLRDAGRNVRVVIAGDGPLEGHLHGRVTSESLPVDLVGRSDQVPALLAAADVVVVPSRWEGQPLIVQEALHAGAAIVATDAGGTASVAGEGAVLVPAEDAQALADAVAALLDAPEEAAALRERARARAAELPVAADAVAQVRDLLRETTHAT